MKKCFSLLAATVVTISAMSQNQTVTVDKLDPFGKLQVNGKIELFVTIDPEAEQSMRVEMNENDPTLLKWWVTEGALQIKFSPKSKGQPVKIRLNCRTLESIDVQVASVTIEGTWASKMLTANLATGAKFSAEISCKDLRVTMQSGATALIKGEACWADYDVRTKSVLDARALAGVSTTLRTSTFSETYIYGTERIVIDAVDGASVFYRGTPEIFRERVARGGHTNAIGE
jgi:hypothetical protein